jgi:uncharacterized protein (TIGR02145 family)
MASRFVASAINLNGMNMLKSKQLRRMSLVMGCGLLGFLGSSTGGFGQTSPQGKQGSSPTVSDREGNLYRVVQIGNQFWMAENLRTSLYANGDSIPGNIDQKQWCSLTAGAQAVFAEGETEVVFGEWGPNHVPNGADDAKALLVYGRLYNGFAVQDSRRICPTGWHVPTEEDVRTLVDFCGGEAVAGIALKDGANWFGLGGDPGTNSSGFTALPGGYREGSYGYFASSGVDGNWWESTPKEGMLGRFAMYADDENVSLGNAPLQTGFSVRCLRDR